MGATGLGSNYVLVLSRKQKLHSSTITWTRHLAIKIRTSSAA